MSTVYKGGGGVGLKFLPLNFNTPLWSCLTNFGIVVNVVIASRTRKMDSVRDD